MTQIPTHGRRFAPRTALGLTLLFSTALVPPTFAHSGDDHVQTPEDKAICDRIFSAMDKADQSAQLAQADDTSNGEKSKSESEGDLATELSAMLQACSYDGKALTIRAKSLIQPRDASGEEAVRNIMRFTGLPQNFKVVEGDVPNAAAMIVMGSNGLPERVIAYNITFMKQVRSATENNDWASVSIMAHEIGHHLSGHTLVPGGSQPPIELEADKFSGFVLFKMGAKLDDAEAAIKTLVPEQDGPTHPGRAKRLVAIQSGWMESCEQQPGGCKDGEDTVAAVQPPKPAESAPPSAPAETGKPSMPDIPSVADIKIPSLDGATDKPHMIPDDPNVVISAEPDRVPKLASDQTPGKFDRFVYDEVGVFDFNEKKKLATLAYQYAAANDVEIVTIIAKDLQGLTPDEYALQAMRQLRVGKLEVGNGAVLVVAPNSHETGVALGAGLAIEYDDLDQLRSYLDSYFKIVDGGGRPDAAADLISEASYRIMRDTKSWEWAIRYHDLAQMLAIGEKFRADRMTSTEPYDPAKDPTWRKLVRVTATVVTQAPAKDDKKLDINAVKEDHMGQAMHMRTEDGQNIVAYVHPSVPALMPTKLEDGGTYSFILRDSFMAADTPQFDLISYDRVE